MAIGMGVGAEVDGTGRSCALGLGSTWPSTDPGTDATNSIIASANGSQAGSNSTGHDSRGSSGASILNVLE